MNVQIVYAHPEPKSFCGAMKDLAVETLTDAGHKVQVSDLYAMNFKTVADGSDFDERIRPDYLVYHVEQQYNFGRGTLAEDIRNEQEKLLWSDMLMMVFPLWWFSMPAIMKGWADRVFAAGFSYEMKTGMFYEHGGLKGRQAMLALTTGGPESMYLPDGIHGSIERLLYPINHGLLRFSGFEVLQPTIAWGVALCDDEGRKAILDRFRQRLLDMRDRSA